MTSSSVLENQEFSKSISTNSIIGWMIVGKHAWQPKDDQKEDSSTVLMIQEQLLMSELFRDTPDVISLILYYKTM